MSGIGAGGVESAAVGSASPSRRPAVFSVRILAADYYLADPDARFQGEDGLTPEFAPLGTPLRCVPVLRVFGLTPQGQKCLVHVHNVFPYFYVPYEGPDPPLKARGLAEADEGGYYGNDTGVDDDRISEACRLYIYRMGASLDRAMAAFSNRGGQNDPKKSQYVRAIRLVKGINFYGFHSGYSYFLKIYLLDPANLIKCEELLQRGAVLGRNFDTFESHLPYTLQFFLDHNLYGMDLMHLADVRFRRPVGLNERFARDPNTFLKNGTVPEHLIWPDEGPWESPYRQSHLDLELDAWPSDICNRDLVSEKPEEALIDLAGPRKDKVPSKKHVPSVDALWEDERDRRRRAGLDPAEVEAAVDKENQVPRDPQPEFDAEGKRICRWGGEQLLWDQIKASVGRGRLDQERLARALAEKERLEEAGVDEALWDQALLEDLKIKPRKPVEELFPKLDDLDDGAVPTTWQSAELLWPVSLPWRVPEEEEFMEEIEVELESEPAQARPVSDHEFLVPLAPAGPTTPFPFPGTMPNRTQLTGSVRRPRISMTPWEMAERRRTLTQFERLSTPLASENGEAEEAEQEADDIRLVFNEDVINEIVATPLTKPGFAHPELFGEMEREIERLREEEQDEDEVVEKPDDELPPFEGPEELEDEELEDEELEEELVDGDGGEKSEEDEEANRRIVLDYEGVEAEFLQEHYNELFSYAPSGVQHAGPADEGETVEEDSIVKRRKTLPQYDGPAFDDVEDGDEDDTLRQDAQKSASRRSRRMKSLSSVGESLRRKSDNFKLPVRDSGSASLSVSASQPQSKKTRVGSLRMVVQQQTQEDDCGLVVSQESKDRSGPPAPLINADELALGWTQTLAMDEDSAPPAAVNPLARNPEANLLLPGVANVPGATDLNLWSTPSGQNGGMTDREIFGSPPRCVSPGLVEDATPMLLDDPEEEIHDEPMPPAYLDDEEKDDASPSLVSIPLDKIKKPPSAAELLSTLQKKGVPEAVHRRPYYSDPKDVPPRLKKIAGREVRIPGDGLDTLKPFESTVIRRSSRLARGLENFVPESTAGKRLWIPVALPPTRQSLLASLATSMENRARGESETNDEEESSAVKFDKYSEGLLHLPKKDVSQLEGPTPENTYGFKFDQNKTDSITHTQQYLSILSVEIHVNTRDALRPDPAHDSVEVIFYCLQTENHAKYPDNGHRKGFFTGMLRVDRNSSLKRMGLGHLVEELVPTEEELFRKFSELVLRVDPDIIVGYEVQSLSWGYLIERASKIYEIDLCADISRVRDKPGRTRYTREDDQWGYTRTSSVHIDGRIVLNIWRLMVAELNLTSYTLENLAYHILHQRIPHFSFGKLTQWYNGSHRVKWRTISYYMDRVQKNLELLEDTDLIGRTSEFARIFGIEFFSVISRGSQFKVESVMARIAKPRNFLLFSPSRKQVHNQRAIEALPLIMEPESAFYPDPLVVLDFQSLYPSVMIGYNYCYSTCLGRTASIGKEHQFGASLLKIPAEVIEALKDDINVSPNGLVFVKPHIREGVLRKMLTALLDTRVMVKQAMKRYKSDRALSRLLDARQLGLKYLANVTYGYTNANFSGRMPCAEIADSIVQAGRETLERAKISIDQNGEWGARVVYGDTDSLFINLEGCSFDRAFTIGKDIVDRVTRVNPYPVKLKFEKVYFPCVLQTKKRYVGAMYETPDQPTFAFDAKGIETVRRDGCPAVAKTLEKCLRMLFTSADLSPIKAYVQRQFQKILEGRVSVQDLIIAKEVRIGTYKETGLPPPGAWLSTALMEADPRAEPQYKERVPYCVAHTGPSSRLVDSVVTPQELVTNRSVRIHGTYYVTKQIIPALKRVFDLMGADVQAWYDEVPKNNRAIRYAMSQTPSDQGSQKRKQLRGVPRQRNTMTIERYYALKSCSVCNESTNGAFCPNCESHPQRSAQILHDEAAESARAYHRLMEVCKACSGHRTPDTGGDQISCDSLDCPIMYARVSAENKLRQGESLLRSANLLPKSLAW